mmetsp:Transcript_48723/g.106095  ORF Transcript_48723/g.106095 Transcript_48723/m.106095 type:complete len:235 (-) Transcript_48723:660-1364(-)
MAPPGFSPVNHAAGSAREQRLAKLLDFFGQLPDLVRLVIWLAPFVLVNPQGCDLGLQELAGGTAVQCLLQIVTLALQQRHLSGAGLRSVKLLLQFFKSSQQVLLLLRGLLFSVLEAGFGNCDCLVCSRQSTLAFFHDITQRANFPLQLHPITNTGGDFHLCHLTIRVTKLGVARLKLLFQPGRFVTCCPQVRSQCVDLLLVSGPQHIQLAQRDIHGPLLDGEPSGALQQRGLVQ